MAIHRLLERVAFEPEAVEVMSAAYAEALRALDLANGGDAVCEAVAKRVVEFAHRGERDPGMLCELVVRSFVQ